MFDRESTVGVLPKDLPTPPFDRAGIQCAQRHCLRYIDRLYSRSPLNPLFVPRVRIRFDHEPIRKGAKRVQHEIKGVDAQLEMLTWGQNMFE